jgi:hypothetical protein
MHAAGTLNEREIVFFLVQAEMRGIKIIGPPATFL